MRYIVVIICVLGIAYLANDYLISTQFSNILNQTQTGTVQNDATGTFISGQVDLPPAVNELIDQLEIEHTYHPSQQTYYLGKINRKYNNQKLFGFYIKSLLSDNLYDQAWGECLSSDNKNNSGTIRHCINAGFNSLDTSADHWNDVSAMILKSREQDLISQQEYDVYQRLIGLTKLDFTGSSASIKKLQHPLITKINNQLKEYSYFTKPPQSYWRGLVASVLVQEGYYTLAQQISYKALADDPIYILPYQVLSYVGLYAQRPQVGIPALKKLFELDEHNTPLYRLMFGIQSYRKTDYLEAVTQLKQVKTQKLQGDVTRYLALSYRGLGDYKNMNEQFGTIISQNAYENDYREYFYSIWSIHDRLGTGDLVNNTHPLGNIAQDPTFLTYIGNCNQTSQVCEYGKMIQQLYAGQTPTIDENVTDSRLMALYGDYYSLIRDSDTAKKRWYKAITQSQHFDLNQRLKDLIISRQS